VLATSLFVGSAAAETGAADLVRVDAAMHAAVMRLPVVLQTLHERAPEPVAQQ